MKKTIAILLAFCLCVGLCACGGNSEPTEPAKSAEAQKADELILAIGEVSMDNESVILAAKAYYDTLTDEQKAQVENVAVLETAVADLDVLKKEGEYKAAYDKAVEYETNLQIDEAYAEYEKLPTDYEDVAQRMSAISPLVGVAGTWLCDNYTAVSNKGTELGAMFKTINISISSFEDGRVGLSTEAVWADSQYTNSSIVAGYADLLFVLDSGGAWGEPTQDENGNWILGDSSSGKTGFGTLTITYSITAEGKLIVEYSRKNNNDITTVAFTYSKPQ